jgi:hypothetical protein
MARSRGEFAPPVEVPLWITFTGTQFVVVAAETEAHARAIIRYQQGGLVDRKVKHTAREIRVRRLRVEDTERIESWERLHAEITNGRKSRYKSLYNAH